MRFRVFKLGVTFAILGALASVHAITPKASQRIRIEAERAWPAFFVKFRAAVKRRDRSAIKEMMVKDFYFSGGGGDDNHDGDSRDEAFAYWDDQHFIGWKALDRTLAGGTVPTARWWGNSADGKRYPSRVAPPAANIRRNIDRARIDWLAFFEFRNGRWYCTSFSECCD